MSRLGGLGRLLTGVRSSPTGVSARTKADLSSYFVSQNDAESRDVRIDNESFSRQLRKLHIIGFKNVHSKTTTEN